MPIPMGHFELFQWLTSNILGIDHETRLFQSSIPIARSRHTTALFQGCVRVSSSCRGGFLCINKPMSKQICPVWLQGQGIGFMRRGTPLWGVGGVGLPPFYSVFLLSWPCPIALSPADRRLACPVTYLLSSQTFVKRGLLKIDYYFGFSGYNACAGRQTLGYGFPVVQH